jgi:hypothetical protein
MGLTYKQKFNKKYGFSKDESHTIQEISKITGYDYEGLMIILRKGEGAFYSNHKSVRPNVKSATEWGIARIYSAITPGSKASVVDAHHLIKK